MNRHVHIISYDIPYPADTPLLRDTMNKIMALKENGVNVHLHCYAYGKERSSLLDDLCHEVHYYERNKGHKGFALLLPYIVSSRANKELENRLQKDSYPIIFEGLHTTYLLNDTRVINNRKTILRLHRLESAYYRDLLRITPFGAKKIYYFIEHVLCKSYEKKILNKTCCITKSEELNKKIHSVSKDINPIFIPQFTGLPIPFYKAGKGGFCLYYGKLSERENEYAAMWLLENVFSKIEIPFVVAGRGPSDFLEKAAHLRMHTCLVADPSEKELQDLIKKAQVCVLPSFISSNTGDSIRESLMLGKHVLTNKKGAKEPELFAACSIAKTPEEYIEKVKDLFEKEYTEDDHFRRESLLNNTYRHKDAVNQLIKILY
ncbi:MAG: glycosyltransferase [bacterium]